MSLHIQTHVIPRMSHLHSTWVLWAPPLWVCLGRWWSMSPRVGDVAAVFGAHRGGSHDWRVGDHNAAHFAPIHMYCPFSHGWPLWVQVQHTLGRCVRHWMPLPTIFQRRIPPTRPHCPPPIISNVVGLLVLISYCVIPLLRQRTFIFIGLATIMIHSVWFSIPYWHQIAQHGMGQGARVLCSSSSTEYTQDNFNCAMNGILYIFFLYSSNLANLFLAWSLVEKICLHQYLRLTPRQEMWKTRIMVATCFALPAVAVIVALACKNINGTNIAMLYCFISRERDATDVPDMSLLLGYIIPGIIMGSGYIVVVILFVLCENSEFCQKSQPFSHICTSAVIFSHHHPHNNCFSSCDVPRLVG